MANENAKKFEELLRSDEGLQAKLKAAVDAYEGDKADAQSFFDATIGKLAADAGLPFSYEEGRTIAQDGVELSDQELEAVAGGESAWCYIIGGQGDTGARACSGGEESGAGACAYAGVTFQLF